MYEPRRTQMRVTLPSDLTPAFRQAKTEAEQASGVSITDPQFALALIRKALSVSVTEGGHGRQGTAR